MSDRPLGRRAVMLAGAGLVLAGATAARAEDEAPQVETIDRVVVRWHARATGGVRKPQFIMARELAFEARLEALVDPTSPVAQYGDKHVRAAVQRRIAETILAELPVNPKPTPRQVAVYAEAARKLLHGRVGDKGAAAVTAARKAEGITREELDAMLRRRARASWYLDKTVAPMLRPSELDLREAHERGETPFTDRRFEDVQEPLRRWYIATRLADALDRYFRNIRTRVSITVVGHLPRPKRRGDERAAR